MASLMSRIGTSSMPLSPASRFSHAWSFEPEHNPKRPANTIASQQAIAGKNRKKKKKDAIIFSGEGDGANFWSEALGTCVKRESHFFSEGDGAHFGSEL